MEQRGSIPVSLPHPHPTTSYWHEPRASIADHRTTPDLPATADYVIIGSGISGACIAFNLLEKRPDAKITMLEARTACGGATGRNGGHTKASSYRSFVQNARALGVREATLIARLEHDNIKATHAFAREHGIDCDSHPCRTVDIVYAQDRWDAALKAIEHMQEVCGDGESGETGVDSYTVHGPEETAKRFLCTGAVGSLEYDAGSISGYNFTIGVLKLALKKGLNLQTNTPVTSVVSHAQSNGSTNGNAVHAANSWTVISDRGSITTPNVIFATNGYTASLLPQKFQGIIVPLRGQMSVQRPGSNLPHKGSLPTTYSFIYDVGYEYMITRPAGSLNAGDIVIGGGWAIALPDRGESEFGETDDSVCQPKISTYLNSSCADKYFGKENWGDDAAEGRLRREWTGIMGTSADGLPFVGKVPGMEGCWVSVSFDGHGMVLCLKSAEALTTMLLDGETSPSLDSWFPNSFRVTGKRLTERFQGRRNVAMPR